jgi:hypothetical protein
MVNIKMRVYRHSDLINTAVSFFLFVSIHNIASMILQLPVTNVVNFEVGHLTGIIMVNPGGCNESEA